VMLSPLLNTYSKSALVNPLAAFSNVSFDFDSMAKALLDGCADFHRNGKVTFAAIQQVSQATPPRKGWSRALTALYPGPAPRKAKRTEKESTNA